MLELEGIYRRKLLGAYKCNVTSRNIQSTNLSLMQLNDAMVQMGKIKDGRGKRGAQAQEMGFSSHKRQCNCESSAGAQEAHVH